MFSTVVSIGGCLGFKSQKKYSQKANWKLFLLEPIVEEGVYLTDMAGRSSGRNFIPLI